jgi:hypothetical protein
MKGRRVLANLGILVTTGVLGLLLCEFGSRLILNPADYLSVEMVHDPVLGAVPSPGTRGFDGWGFRNRGVPETADIVAVGDSHTYGNTARMDDSWPYVLGRLSGQRVYNLGMGGYGPNQYFYLVKTKALSLKPWMVLCGLYMGDDFENAYSITYGLDHWTYLRQLLAKDVRFDIWETAPAPLSWHKKIRVWLSRHSVTYQLVFHGPLTGRVQGEVQIRNAAQLYDSATSLNIPEKNILEAFRPKGMLLRIDQENPAVREGMRVTFELLREMNEICRRNHVQFVVVVIPIKELVFSDYLEHNASLRLSAELDKLAANGRMARERTFQFLTDSGISYVDTLPALRKSVGQQLYARTAADMHPNKNGYRVIAEAVFDNLRLGPSTSPRGEQQAAQAGGAK